MSLNLPPKEYEDAILAAENDTIIIRGEISSMNPSEYLVPFLEEAFQQAADMGEVTIDFSGMDFINSSGIGCFLKQMKTLPTGLSVRIITDPAKTWQQTSMNIMQLVNPDKIRLE
jgi:anti-anti-sigma regulatory factor